MSPLSLKNLLRELLDLHNTFISNTMETFGSASWIEFMFEHCAGDMICHCRVVNVSKINRFVCDRWEYVLLCGICVVHACPPHVHPSVLCLCVVKRLRLLPTLKQYKIKVVLIGRLTHLHLQIFIFISIWLILQLCTAAWTASWF